MRSLALLIRVALATLLVALLPLAVCAQSSDVQRRELDAQAGTLRDTIRLLENERNRLGYTGADLQKRTQINDLLSRKREELRAVESLRSSLGGRPDPSTVNRKETQLQDAENRSLREEIEALEQERNRLGYTGDDLRRRTEINDLLSRKRELLRAGEAQRRAVQGDPSSQERADKRAIEAEIRELNEEIRVLERERTRLGYTGDDLRRRNDINALLSRKRELLRAKERQRSGF
jgi:hypothetical protein